MEYLPDIFYDTNKISKNQFKKLMIEARTLSYNWWVDDQPSWTRRKIDMPFNKVLDIFHETTRKNLHITVIHRRGYENMDHYLEIGFCTLGRKSITGDIFLWICVDLEYKEELLKKYNIWKLL